MERFIKRFNDYSCLNSNDAQNVTQLSHYTHGTEVACSICNGIFWATDMKDFKDRLEGRLILQMVYKICCEDDTLSEEDKGFICDYIGTDKKIENFISAHKTFVLSTCLNTNSQYMWKEYAKENGYNIILNKETFVESLHFFTKGKVKKCNNYIKHARILYSTDIQHEVIKHELHDLMELDMLGLSKKEKIDYVLTHLMYVGNFYKGEDYKDEEEYRFLINTINPTETGLQTENLIPEIYTENDCSNAKCEDKRNKSHIELHFDRAAIDKVICTSVIAKTEIEKRIKDIPIELMTHCE